MWSMYDVGIFPNGEWMVHRGPESRHRMDAKFHAPERKRYRERRIVHTGLEYFHG